MSAFQPYVLLCLLSLCIVCVCRQSDSITIHAGSEESHYDQPEMFLHRHSFGHDIKQPQHETMAFEILDTADTLGALSSHFKPAIFNLRTQLDIPEHHGPMHEQTQPNNSLLPAANSRPSPNTRDKETVVNLAKMTSDAYLFDPHEPDWRNTSLGFNFTSRLPWKDDSLQGHVFSTEDYDIVVVAFKGTSIDPRGRTSVEDAINDNRLFSCCCRAQNPYHYTPVCNCSTGYYQCSSDCLTNSVLQNDSYYDAAIYIMGRVHDMYPSATLWVVGHSLGGSLASLVGLTINIPAVTFEAPPERLPAERMGLLPVPFTATAQTHRAGAHHFGNTADPVYMGACNGFISSCSLWGFSFESQCFTGRRCAYDTVKDKGWRSSITNHRINYVIENVLEVYDDVPTCEEDVECVDCYLWKFG